MSAYTVALCIQQERVHLTAHHAVSTALVNVSIVEQVSDSSASCTQRLCLPILTNTDSQTPCVHSQRYTPDSYSTVKLQVHNNSSSSTTNLKAAQQQCCLEAARCMQ
jgi:hypothetical protein